MKEVYLPEVHHTIIVGGQEQDIYDIPFVHES